MIAVGVVMLIVGAVVSLAALIAVRMVIDGWTLSVLWGWFMVPLFHLHYLTVWQAMGLGLVVTFATWQKMPEVEAPKKKWSEKVATLVVEILVRPAIILGVGWVIHTRV